MVQAVGASQWSSIAASVGSAATGVALQAQLDRYSKQLADCVNCESAKTPAGKKNIQTITAKISEVKARMEEASATHASKPASPTPPASADTATNTSMNTTTSTTPTSSAQVSAGSSNTSRLLDTFA